MHKAPEAIQNLGGDLVTYKVACKVKDFGISRDTCVDLMVSHWNENKAHPNWDYDDLVQKVDNAYRYGNQPPGSASALVGFEAVDLDSSMRDTSNPTNQSGGSRPTFGRRTPNRQRCRRVSSGCRGALRDRPRPSPRS